MAENSQFKKPLKGSTSLPLPDSVSTSLYALLLSDSMSGMSAWYRFLILRSMVGASNPIASLANAIHAFLCTLHLTYLTPGEISTFRTAMQATVSASHPVRVLLLLRNAVNADVLAVSSTNKKKAASLP
jgi:hypothetical protein